MKLPKSVKKKLEELDKKIKLYAEYARQCDNPDDLDYWNAQIDKLRENRFLIKVIGYGLVAMSRERRRKTRLKF